MNAIAYLCSGHKDHERCAKHIALDYNKRVKIESNNNKKKQQQHIMYNTENAHYQ